MCRYLCVHCNRGIRVNFFVINLLKKQAHRKKREYVDNTNARSPAQDTTKCVNKQHSKIQLTAFNCNC